MAMGQTMIPGRPTPSSCHRHFPDLAPWLDNVSDDYDELPSGDHEVPYDE
jgi:hypothetical protein